MNKKLLLLLPILVCLLLASCQNGGSAPVSGTESDTYPASLEVETTAAPETSVPAPETSAEVVTEPALPESTEGTPAETRPSSMPEGMFEHPLTGMPCETDFSLSRPVGIMINNIPDAMPQVGVSKADIMYECLVEGGFTRLMMVVSDYANLDVVGSVRSSRDYYLDMCANHDAIYVHAGGSPMAYKGIRERFINNLDGVNMYTPDTFYRDAERMKTMSLEHTLMTTGKGIVSGIKFKNYRTEKPADYPAMFNFTDLGSERTPEAMNAESITIPYSFIQTSSFVYDAEKKLYAKNYNGEPHLDSANGEQLAYDNLLLIFCNQTVYTDGSGRIDLEYIGGGEGYYVYGGKAEPIKWHRYDRDAVMELKAADDSPLTVNRGKTFIAIVNTAMEGSVKFE
ncbi:MAG: DUF3048 domain-containing protein [Ruminococcaceae bacterium]|nr:DUF3048 domain-containing protein [Oscillospiraceae bacterium]